MKIEEVKQYLRVDFDDDDLLIENFIKSAKKRCSDIARIDINKLKKDPNTKIAILYCVAFLYENREKADHNELNKTLRALLFGSREERF